MDERWEVHRIRILAEVFVTGQSANPTATENKCVKCEFPSEKACSF